MKFFAVEVLIMFVAGFIAVKNYCLLTLTEARIANQESVDLIPMVILTDRALMTSCITGAFFGAIVAACVWKTSETDPGKASRIMARNFLASGICGVVITPAFMRYFELQLDVDYIIGVSAAVAFCAVAVLEKISVPLIEWVVKKITRAIGGDK